MTHTVTTTMVFTDTYFEPNQIPKTDEKLSDFGKVDTRIPNQTTEAQLATLKILNFGNPYPYVKGKGATIEELVAADTVVVVMDHPGLNDNMLFLTKAIDLNKNILLILPDGTIDKTEQEKYRLKFPRTT